MSLATFSYHDREFWLVNATQAYHTALVMGLAKREYRPTFDNMFLRKLFPHYYGRLVFKSVVRHVTGVRSRNRQIAIEAFRETLEKKNIEIENLLIEFVNELDERFDEKERLFVEASGKKHA